MRLGVSIALLSLCGLVACRDSGAPATAPVASGAGTQSAPPSLPDDDAGRLISRAIDAAGGWAAWQGHRDAEFISTMTIFDGGGTATSETIFLHKLPLHDGLKTRLESIGLSEELVVGFDGHDAWMLRNGRPVTEPSRLTFTRFHAISTLYWFNLPFVLAELPGKLTYLGSEQAGPERWEKVRVAYDDQPGVPADWLVLYFDAASGLIDQVHCHITAAFLRQSLWIGKWQEYRDIGGIKRERRRTFYPANLEGAVTGPLTAEQLIEHVRFDNDYPPTLFVKPPAAGGGSPTR